jgi:transcriptional regulator with XRE-family HTH domain
MIVHTICMPINASELYKRLGAQLRERRQLQGMSQIQLAKAVGLLRTSITNIEAGRQRLPIHVLYQLCQVLKIEVTALLPPSAEIEQAETVPVRIAGVTTEVSPKTAAFLRQELEE